MYPVELLIGGRWTAAQSGRVDCARCRPLAWRCARHRRCFASLGGSAVFLRVFRDVTATKELLTLVQDRLAAAGSGGERPDAATALTRRELDVLRLMVQGLNTSRTAERLRVSPATVRNHVQNIFGKLGVHSRTQAVARARELGLLP